MSKMLILSASPQRDSVIDNLISDELRAKGHEVFVRPCLRQGRQSILELKPDIVVTPPIKNPNSRDMVEQCKKWGMGVVVRHTEPSCDWPDYKAMDDRQKEEIVGKYRYMADVELVWGEDEADILNRRKSPFKALAVGALGLDIYKREDIDTIIPHFAKGKKKRLLIACPWGFADTAPDLQVDDMRTFSKEEEAKARHIEMIKTLYNKLPKDKWEIKVTLHPGIVIDDYKKELEPLGIPIDIESTAVELLVNSDALVHAGSTMAIEAHMLGIPAYQFYDQNCLRSTGWFDKVDGPISKVSPSYLLAGALAADIMSGRRVSNANKEAIKELEKGRYGTMDGQAYKRTAEIISNVHGEFKLSWPLPPRDYTQPMVKKSPQELVDYMHCGLCNNPFYALKDAPDSIFCPNCACRVFKK